MKYIDVRMGLSIIRFYIVMGINGLYCILRRIVWFLNGTNAKIRTNQSDPDNYAVSAQRLYIWVKYKMDIVALCGTHNFFSTHEDFVHPEYVLKDEVTLLQMTDTEAIFVERLPDSEPAHSAKFSFFLIGQFRSARRLIIMPLHSFNRLAESMTGDGGKIVFLHNQARCGSTLLTSIFEYTGRCISMCEPQALNAVCYYIYTLKLWDEATSRRILRNCIRMLAKPYRSLDNRTLAYVIKPTASSAICTDLVAELFPDAVNVFMYRFPIPMAQSLRRTVQTLESIWTIQKLLLWKIPNVTATVLDKVLIVNDKYRGWTPQTTTELELGYKVASNAVYYYLKFYNQGIDIKGICYEDLRDNPESIVANVFELIGLPQSLVSLGLEALKYDSQAATQISRKLLKAALPVVPQPTPEFLDAAREECKSLGIPPPEAWDDKHYRLPNTILPITSKD